MADINGVKFTSTAGTPTVYHTVTYTKSRPSNSTMKYVFTIKTNLHNSYSWIGTGYGLTGKITVGGTSGTATIKSTSASWSGTSDHSVKITITCSSTTGSEAQKVKFEVIGVGGLVAGTMSNSSYTVTSSPLLYTDCTAPTTFTASSNNFESSVKLTWSGAKGGTNNSIKYYYIQYAVSSNNSTWGNWTGLKSIGSSSTSGSYTVDMSSKVSRGYYVKFRIRTEGSAGSSYYSDYKTSSSIRRQPYTICTPPTSFTITPDDTSSDGFNTTLTLNWSGASGGTNNNINAYLIQYCTSSNGSEWGTWTTLQTISSTKTSGSLTKNVSSIVSRGKYVLFRIRTQGTAGSSYYSSYKNSAKAKRNLYAKCTAPETVMISSEADVTNTKHPDVFNKSITIMWTGAKAGENNNIKRYYIEYCTSSNGSTWGSWTTLQSSNLTPAGTTSTTVDVSSKISRGVYMQVRVRTEGEAGSVYYSKFTGSNTIRRNSVPTAPTSFDVAFPVSLEYSQGDSIKLTWKTSTDKDNNLKYYELQSRITTDGVWGSWTNLNTQVASSATLYQIFSTVDLFSKINNNECVQFRMRAYDNFGEVSSYVTSSVVTRYDITGVSIGINGKWVNCQIFVGENGNWVEQDVSVGLNGSWVDAYDGN